MLVRFAGLCAKMENTSEEAGGVRYLLKLEEAAEFWMGWKRHSLSA